MTKPFIPRPFIIPGATVKSFMDLGIWSRDLVEKKFGPIYDPIPMLPRKNRTLTMGKISDQLPPLPIKPFHRLF